MGIEVREENGRKYGRVIRPDYDKQINEAISLVNNRSGNIVGSINDANDLSTDEFKKRVKTREQDRRKRKIKGPKMFEKTKRFIAVAMIGLTIGGAAYGISKIPEYKEEAATRILEEVKEELGADSIYDNSTALSSNSARQEFVVKKDGTTYRYCADIQDGEIFVKEDDLNEETRKAISIAAKAQNGSVFDAIKANKYADKIEKGDINLTIDEKVIINNGKER